MGSGSYSAATYAAVAGARIASGTTFGYHSTASMSANPTAHESLDVKRLNSAGQNIREARDSDEHPVSKPMVIAFDQTGSMGNVPRDMVMVSPPYAKHIIMPDEAAGIADSITITARTYGSWIKIPPMKKMSSGTPAKRMNEVR